MPFFWNVEAAMRASGFLSAILFIYFHFYLIGIFIFVLFTFSEYDEEKVGLTYDEYLEAWLDIYGYMPERTAEIYKADEAIKKQKPLNPEDILTIRTTIEEYREQLKIRIPRVKRGPRSQSEKFEDEPEPINQTSELYELDIYLDQILEEWETRAPIVIPDKDWDVLGLEKELLTIKWLDRRKNGYIDWKYGDYMDSNVLPKIARINSNKQDQFSFLPIRGLLKNNRKDLKTVSSPTNGKVFYPHNAFFQPIIVRKTNKS